MTDSNALLDKVAEAIYIRHELTVRGDGKWAPWDAEWVNRDKWREIARDGLAALGLTEEIRDIPVANGRSCICNRPDGKHSGMGCDINRTDWLPHRRLVSPWVRAGGDQ